MIIYHSFFNYYTFQQIIHMQISINQKDNAQSKIAVVQSIIIHPMVLTILYIRIILILCTHINQQIFLSKQLTQYKHQTLHLQALYHIYESCYVNFNLDINQKLMKAIIKSFFTFATQNHPFQTFLNSAKTEISLKRNPGRSTIGSEVHVPRNPISRESVQSFFESKDIKNRNILVNVDPSHLMGMKRMVSLQYLNASVYKGHSEAVDILKKQNPSTYVSKQELLFDQGVFAVTDPLFVEKAKKQKTAMPLLFQQIEQYYSSHLDRGVERLQVEYLVPPEYLYIVETAYNLGNSIYFIGINEFQLRKIITSYLSLNQIKIMFMEALKYTAQIKNMSSIGFQHKCKELLWKMHYDFMQPINYQLINKLRQEIKGYCFAHPYHFIKPENQTINFKDLKDKELDNTKLQKNAILQIMFGNIWTKPYTNNPFPYLAEPYHSLTPEDKKLVTQIYNSFYNKYKAAKDKFRTLTD